uniref:RUN and SH3 domain containing 1 n=1 Tax=Sus scrofa TaxID=9823 RepID=A0A8D0RZ32_PIG
CFVPSPDPGLLIAVSASVDKIISHFGAARNLVQKAQLGDSRLSPDVGHLVLTTLCPALHALVADGLKPFQKDLITGQRRSSPWSVVEASVKPGEAGGCGTGQRAGLGAWLTVSCVLSLQHPFPGDTVQPGQPPGPAEKQPEPLPCLHPGPPQVSGRLPGTPPIAWGLQGCHEWDLWWILVSSEKACFQSPLPSCTHRGLESSPPLNF